MKPFFSIIIPTRNRAHLLKDAIGSALAQEFPEFEVVVSDNFSSDETRAVSESFGDSRIRYVRTESPLSMTGSWSFALSQANGEWVTILSDDSVLSPTLLQDVYRASPEVEIVSWAHALYFPPGWPEAERRNRLLYIPFSGKRQRKKSKAELLHLYQSLSLSLATPAIFKAFCRRSVLRRVSDKGGDLCLSWAPDYSSAAAVLFQVREFLYLDFPHTIMGTAKESIGESQGRDRGKAFQEYLAEFGEKRFELVPLSIQVQRNFLTETLLQTARAFRERIDVNWETYFYECYRDLLRLEKNGADVNREKEALVSCVEKRRMERLIRKLKDLVYRDDSPWVSVAGDQHGFSSVTSALAFLNSRTLSPVS